jgi:DNA-binding transcriptional regulator YiaG
LVFGRETGFPTQTLQRWGYVYKSPQGMETNLINVF